MLKNKCVRILLVHKKIVTLSLEMWGLCALFKMYEKP